MDTVREIFLWAFEAIRGPHQVNNIKPKRITGHRQGSITMN